MKYKKYHQPEMNSQDMLPPRFNDFRVSWISAYKTQNTFFTSLPHLWLPHWCHWPGSKAPNEGVIALQKGGLMCNEYSFGRGAMATF